MTSPLVTILTPCYRSAAFIERTFDSLERQTYRPLQWVVVNDQSPDNTLELLERCAARASLDVTIVNLPQNRGPLPAVKAGLEHVTGEFTMILDHDDELLARAVETMVGHWLQYAGSFPGLSGVGGRCVDQHGTFLGTPFPVSPLLTNELDLRHRLRIRGELAGMVRTDLLRRFYALGEELTNGPTWRRIARQCNGIYTNDVIRVYHTNIAHSMTNTVVCVSPSAERASRLDDLNGNTDYYRVDPRYFWGVLVRYLKFSVHCGQPFFSARRALVSPVARFAALAALAPAWLLVWRDRRLGRVPSSPRR